MNVRSIREGMFLFSFLTLQSITLDSTFNIVLVNSISESFFLRQSWISTIILSSITKTDGEIFYT